MAAPSPTFSRHVAAGVCMIATVAALVIGPAGSGVAAPKPSKAELKAQLAKLTKKVDRLIEEYGAKREELGKARQAEKVAAERLKQAEEAFAKASRQVGDIAQMRYQAADPSLMRFMFGDDINGAALLEQLAAEEAAHLDGYAEIRDDRKKAAQEAAALTKRISEQAADVDRRRKEAEKLIDQIEKKLDQLIPTSGKRANGTWIPQLPGGPDNITPRTRVLRDEIRERFALRFPIGCYRAGSSGEHPLGRACDFMLSSGGTMPTPENLALGDRICQWAIDNAGKLGVKYVIFKQRIYNMSFPGWRPMADRGSITQNHWDHVHISMH